MKICIIGGVAGGAGAATRLRRLDEEAEIVLFEKGAHISYANCGLPYYIGNIIQDQDALLVTKPELLRNRFRIDVRVNSEVTALHRDRNTLTVINHETGECYEEHYDKIILSPGAAPKRPPMPGIDLPGIFTLRNVTDTLAIDHYITTTSPQSAVVIGGGFIGIEMAENLTQRGLAVTVVEFADQVVAPFDKEMANMLHQHLIENGVTLQLGKGVDGFEQSGGHMQVNLHDQSTVSCDLVLLAMGVDPESSLAAAAGLQLGLKNSIAVNDYFETDDSSIFAVGDAIQITNLVTQHAGLIPLAGPANKQGRLAAENALRPHGKRGMSQGVQGSSVLKVFDLIAASTGLNEKQAKTEQISYRKTYVHPQSHASYYPGATPLSMKLLFTDEGKLLGAQAIGYEGVEKRIDVLATAIRLGGTVYDLEELELCYAPPFSSAKDPVNMLGFTAANILKGDMPIFYAEEIPQLDLTQNRLLDVSTDDEVLMGTIPGAVHIPLDELRDRLQELNPKQPIYVFCRVGLRGYIAARILMQHGFTVYNLSGGYRTYTHVFYQIPTAPTGRPPKGKNTPLASTGHGTEKSSSANHMPTITVNACGLQCPGPIMKVSQAIKEMEEGQRVTIQATDPAFASDIQVWCERTGNQLLSIDRNKATYEVILEKGLGAAAPCPTHTQVAAENDKTMVVFSGDLDKAIAAFIIANGAAAMNRKVTLFFTFWGLNILRKNQHVPVKKKFLEAAFGKMMPRGSKKLGLSRMNMGGMGAKMIRHVMKEKQVSSLEELIQAAMDSGIRIIACQMSMDVMGIRQEELIDGVEIGGVATFLGSAETSDTNLFI